VRATRMPMYALRVCAKFLLRDAERHENAAAFQ
jgi:hypothetical protein